MTNADLSPYPIAHFTDKVIADSVKDRSCVVLSPRYRKKNFLIHHFTSLTDETAYFSLSPESRYLGDFLIQWNAELREYDPKIGKTVVTAVQTEDSTAQDLADAWVADLAKGKQPLSQLILDNFDELVQDEHVAAFFNRLVTKLPKGVQLIINGRHLPIDPWLALVKAKKSVVLGDEQALDGGIFDAKKPQSPHLEIYALSGGDVYVNGMPMNTWDGPLPKHLFYYFVDHPLVTRDEIFETFWPDLLVKEATNVFHVTKRKISERLGFELTSYGGGFYRPSEQMQVHYDVRHFEGLLPKEDEDEINGTSKVSPRQWYQAIRAYRTPFLHRLDTPWINKRREEIKRSHTRALIGVARLYNSLNDTESALHYFGRALREYPEREDVHREVMSIYTALRRPEKVVEQYQLLSGILRRTLNIKPSKFSRDYYKSVIGTEPE